MRKLLLLEFVFLVTAIVMATLLINRDYLTHSMFFLAAFFGFVVSWFENKERSLIRGVSLGLMTGFIWSFIFTSILILFSSAILADTLSDESKLLAQANYLRLNGSISKQLGIGLGNIVIVSSVILMLLSTLIGAIFGLLSTYMVRYSKGIKSRK